MVMIIENKDDSVFEKKQQQTGSLFAEALCDTHNLRFKAEAFSHVLDIRFPGNTDRYQFA